MVLDTVELPTKARLKQVLETWIKKQIKIQPTFPSTVFTPAEIPISVLLSYWLLQYYAPYSKKFKQDFLSLAEKRMLEAPNELPLWEYLMKVMTLWNGLEIAKSINFPIEWINLALEYDLFGSLLQGMLPPKARKLLSSNYSTWDAVKSLQSLLQGYPPFHRIIDPFCGSGRLITDVLLNQNGSKIHTIILSDIMPTAVLVAYCRSLYVLRKQKRDTQVTFQLFIGDAFKTLHEQGIKQGKLTRESLDLVIMNPPFTRVMTFKKQQELHVKWLQMLFSVRPHGQPGLHYYSILLASALLKPGGVIAAILPAATFRSNYADTIQEHVLKTYTNVKLISNTNITSLSVNSGIRELIFIGERVSAETTPSKTVTFVKREVSRDLSFTETYKDEEFIVERATLFYEQNWMKFFLPTTLIAWFKLLLATKLLRTGEELGLHLKRGVELYGPDFFFLPNSNWEIIETTPASLQIKNGTEKKQLEIPKKFVQKILRKASNYKGQIKPVIKEYTLIFPSSKIPEVLQEYVKASEHEATLAKKRFGKNWLTHISVQLTKKSPKGQIFLVDKVGVRTSSTLAFYTETSEYCTKNFHVITNLSGDSAKLLAAWLNSTFFLILFFLSRREIGGSYGRLQISDLYKEKLFLDITEIPEPIKQSILYAFDEFCDHESLIPPLQEQIHWEPRKNLDKCFLDLFNIQEDPDKFLQSLHEITAQFFLELQQRDKQKN